MNSNKHRSNYNKAIKGLSTLKPYLILIKPYWFTRLRLTRFSGGNELPYPFTFTNLDQTYSKTFPIFKIGIKENAGIKKKTGAKLFRSKSKLIRQRPIKKSRFITNFVSEIHENLSKLARILCVMFLQHLKNV